ncbi:MAG TPA: histidine kinase, partial [Isosphaeraceae bacterium]|nr:histidine kinase [Isosphaeraceae bacterium]
MVGRFLRRLDAWSSRLYRLDLDRLRREEELRATMLRQLVIATAAISAFYLLLASLGIVTPSRRLLWSILELLATAVACGWFLHRQTVSFATILLLVVLSHPASFALADFGLESPAGALFVPSILVCGLLVGGYFLGTWTAICGLVVLYIAHVAGEASGDRIVGHRVTSAVLFWWAIFAATGWLSHLFSVQLERLWLLGRGQTQALGRTLELMVTEEPLAELIDRILPVIAEELAAEHISLWRNNRGDGSLRMTATAGRVIDKAERPEAVPVDGVSFWGDLCARRRAIRVSSTSEMGAIFARWTSATRDERELLLVPLVLDQVVDGLLLLEWRTRARHSEDRQELAEVLARQVGLYLQLVHLAHGERLAAVAEERNRMAGEIHDSLAQGFTGVVVQLNAADEMLDNNPSQARKHIDLARELARVSLNEARRSVLALRPQALESAGLPAALRRICRQLATSSEVEVEVVGQEQVLPADVEHGLMRIG